MLRNAYYCLYKTNEKFANFIKLAKFCCSLYGCTRLAYAANKEVVETNVWTNERRPSPSLEFQKGNCKYNNCLPRSKLFVIACHLQYLSYEIVCNWLCLFG